MVGHGMVTLIIIVENNRVNRVVALLGMAISMGMIEEIKDQGINQKGWRIYLGMMKSI